MALESKEITIQSGGDKGKTFVVEQMPLMRGDKWSNRVKLALLRGGVDVKALGFEKGKFTGLIDIAGVLNVALKALGGLDDDEAQLLLDEVTKGAKLKLPDGGFRPVIFPTDEKNSPDITDIDTLWTIRIESIKVNTNFLMAGTTLK